MLMVIPKLLAEDRGGDGKGQFSAGTNKRTKSSAPTINEEEEIVVSFCFSLAAGG